MPYLTDQAAPISLGKQLAEGGVSNLYEVAGDGGHVAKIYHKPLLDRTARKLAELIRFSPPTLLPVTAWPISALRPSADQPPRGLLMRRISDSQSLHTLVCPAQRQAAFSSADWRFLVRTAGNCATLVDAAHRAGVILGDVHESRFLVDQDANVQLIDCDSCQIITPDEAFCCSRAVPEFLAPEIQAVALEAFPQSANHDSFGLAVVIFRLLMMGRHPFVGYQSAGSMPIPRAIQEFRFAFGSTAGSLMMTPPPHSPLLSDLSGEVASLFQRAFSRGSEREGARPTARQWTDALSAMERELKACPADPGHVFTGAQCPWCRIEAEGGPGYFTTVTVEALRSRPQPINTRQLSARMEAIDPPEKLFAEAAAGEVATPAGRPLPAGTRERQQAVYALAFITVCSALLMLLGFLSPNFFYIGLVPAVIAGVATVVAWVRAPLRRIRRERRQKLAETQAELANVERQIQSRSSRLVAAFAARYKSAAATRDQLQTLQDQETREMRLLQATVRERQLNDFLAGFSLDNAKIAKLTYDRLLILQSYGMESASQVNERVLAAVHGIGESLPAGLLAWRRTLEAKFSFDDRRGLPPTDVVKVRNRYLEQRLSLQDQLEVDLEQLAVMSSQARDQAAQIADELAAPHAAVAQARADLNACGRESPVPPRLPEPALKPSNTPDLRRRAANGRSVPSA